MRTPVDYVELNNPHCDYLPEFIQMREFIANRNVELEDKSDFSRWLDDASEVPVDPCQASVDDFNNASNSLLDLITTTE